MVEGGWGFPEQLVCLGHTGLPVAVWTRPQSTQTQAQGRQVDHPAVGTLVVLTWK